MVSENSSKLPVLEVSKPNNTTYKKECDKTANSLGEIEENPFCADISKNFRMTHPHYWTHRKKLTNLKASVLRVVDT